MRRSLLVFAGILAVALLTVSASSQTCSKLTATGTGKPGTELTFALTGADKEALAVIMVSPKVGKTVLKIGPLGTLTLGLAKPTIPIFIGKTDEKGNAKAIVKLPQWNFPQIALNAQAFTAVFSLKPPGPPKLTFCTSNVAKFTIGG